MLLETPVFGHPAPPIRRAACPDNEMTQPSQLSSWPLSFDRICQTTHGYALGQRPLFGRSGHLWVNRATTSAPKAARQHPCGGRAAQRLAQVRSLNRSEPFGATYGFAVRREPAQSRLAWRRTCQVRPATSLPRLTKRSPVSSCVSACAGCPPAPLCSAPHTRPRVPRLAH